MGTIFVEFNKMKVLKYGSKDYDLVDETILNLNDFMRVKPMSIINL